MKLESALDQSHQVLCRKQPHPAICGADEIRVTKVGLGPGSFLKPPDDPKGQPILRTTDNVIGKVKEVGVGPVLFLCDSVLLNVGSRCLLKISVCPTLGSTGQDDYLRPHKHHTEPCNGESHLSLGGKMFFRTSLEHIFPHYMK